MSGLPASLVFAPPKHNSPGQPSPPRPSPGQQQGGGASGSKARNKATDAASWAAEYERVKARLVLTGDPGEGRGSNSSNGEWRPELERAGTTLRAMQATAGEARSALEGVGLGLAGKLQALGALEERAGAALQGPAEQAAALERQLAGLRAEHASKQEAVAELHKELGFLNGELEARRRHLEEQGDQMSSTQPAAQLRAAIQELRGELVQMDVRVGVLQHLLLRTW